MTEMAAKTKYGKCIHTKDLIRRIAHYDGESIVAHDGELEADCSIGYHCIAKPMSFDFPHAHKFPEMLCFIGGRAENISDFRAEIEFTLGGEKHLINKPAVVSIPAGVKHCPIVFKKVEKPLVFLEISLTRIWKPGRRPPSKKQAEAVKKSGTAKRSQ
jgi:mannose-6-phosphate isomerase-like protein (cupin superfamily)